MKFVFSPDVNLCGLLGSKHHKLTFFNFEHEYELLEHLLFFSKYVVTTHHRLRMLKKENKKKKRLFILTYL